MLCVARGDFGRLGHGQANDVFIPKSVAALAGEIVQSVACGDTHTLVITTSGALYAFGRNQNGQLGLGTNDDGMLPRQVEKLKVCLNFAPWHRQGLFSLVHPSVEVIEHQVCQASM